MTQLSKRFWSIWGALLLCWLGAGPLFAIDPDSFVFLKTYSDSVLINPALEALYLDNRLFVPFTYLTEDLSLPLSYDPEKQVISGWIETESNRVKINLKKHTGSVGKNMFDFTANDFLLYEDQLFLQQELIDKIAQTSSHFNFSSQTLQVETTGNLPFEKELSRREKQALFDRARQEREKERLENLNKTVHTQKDFLQPPFFDLSARYSVTKNHHQPTENALGYSANASFLTGGFDSEANLYSSSEDTPPFVTLKTTRISEEKPMLGLFKQLELGDIYSFGSLENPSAVTGYGIKMSTESPLEAEGKTYTIRDTLPLGWEVELYRNEELLAYQNESQNGYFEFTNIPLLLGKNVFKLVFYGPQGQVKEREEILFFNGNILDKGKTRLRLNYINKNRYLVETHDKPRPSSLGYNGFVEAGYGLTDNLTLNVSAIADSLELELIYPPGDFYRKDKTFAAADLSLFTYGIFSSLGTLVDFENHAATVNYYAQTSWWDWDLVFENIYFGRVVAQRNAIGTTFMKNETSFRANKTLTLGPLGKFPFSYSIHHFTVWEGDPQTEQAASLSKSLPHNIYLNGSYQNAARGSTTHSEQLSFLANHIRGPWTLRGNVVYDLLFDRLSNAEASLYRSLTQRLKAGAKYTYVARDLTARSYEQLYAFSLNWSTKWGYLSLETGTSDRKNSYAFIGYNVSLLPNWHNRTLYASSSKLHGTGALSALAFMDENTNGIREEDEPILSEVGFDLKPHVNVYDNRKQHNDGSTVITHIPAYRAFDVSANTKNVQETLSLLNVAGAQTVRLRPAQIMHVEFPIVGTGDIEGTVYLKTGERDAPAKGIIVLLYKGDQVVGRKVSEYDGFFDFPQVPLGSYTLQLDPTQTHDLDILLPQPISMELQHFEQLITKDMHLVSTKPQTPLVSLVKKEAKRVAAVKKAQKRAAAQRTGTPAPGLSAGPEVEIEDIPPEPSLWQRMVRKVKSWARRTANYLQERTQQEQAEAMALTKD